MPERKTADFRTVPRQIFSRDEFCHSGFESSRPGTGAARTEQAGQGSNKMDKKNDQIAHRRIVAGREIVGKYGRNNNSPATG
jgi:hypothetical protein